MEQKLTNLDELTPANVWDISEEEAFELMQLILNGVEKEKKSQLLKIIESAFEFRTISTKRRDLKQSLILLGFKFFKPNDNSNMITGIFKKKSLNKSFY
ncbi:MAG: hypothetical protein AB7S48_02410 [Bacteroidales bacterium]